MIGQREPQMLLPAASPAAVGRLRVAPCSLSEANDLVARWHRHHAPAVGYRYALQALDEAGVPHGAVIVGRPVARMTDYRVVAEVTRLVTDGTRNACSLLYAAAARVAREMGFARIQTFILDSEPGTSLRAAGWALETTTEGGQWVHTGTIARGGYNRTDQPTGKKQRWSKTL